MKPKSSLRSFLAALGGSILTISYSQADTLYWDVDGTTDGFSTVIGAWNGTNAFWNSDITGGAGTTTATTTTSDDLNFVAATVNTGSITLSGLAKDAGTLTYGSTVGAITLTGGTLNLAAAATITTNSVVGTVHSIASTLSGAGTSLTKAGVGTLYLTYTTNTFNPGAISVSGGILRIGNNTNTTLNSGAYAGNISIASGATLQFYNATGAQTLSGIISGAGNFTKMGTGALTLGTANTYTGKTLFAPQLNGGGFTVNVSSFNSVVSGTMETGMGPVATPVASSSLGAPTTVANGTIDLNAPGQGSVNLTYTGAAALGETTDRGIFLGFNGSAGHTITANNASGVLRFTSAFTSNSTGSGQLTLTGTGAGQIDQGLPQIASGGLNKNGTGTWTLGGSGLFTGPTVITAGTLSLSSATALQNSPFNTASVLGGASAGLKIATTTLTLGGLTGANALDSRFTTALGGPSNATAQGGYAGLTALTLNTAVASSTSTYSGNIVDGATGMTLTKNGAGTQFLTGTIGYTGSTTVNAGTLGSNGTFSGALTVALDAGLSPGASAGAFGTLTISNASASALTLNGGNLLMDVSTASNDLIAVTGTTVLNGTNTVFLNPTTGVAAGTYDLVTHAATTGSGSVVFANGTTTLGNATLAVNAGNIRMTVGAGDLNNSVWVGTSGTWDAGTNWNRNGTPASAFSAGDWVTIDDTGSNAAAITSAAAVSPASLTVNNSSKAFIINANIGGTGTPLIKSGTNTLTLGGTNTYSGGTVINGGVLSVTNNNQLGDTSVGITLAGGQLHGNGFNYSMTRSVTVNGTGSSMRVGRNNNITTSGALTGSGAITFVDNGGAGNLSLYRFTSSGNSFTGAMTLGVADVRVSSLGDTSGNNIIFTGAGIFKLNDTGATAGLTFNNRAIELRNTGATIENLNTTHALTIGSNLVATGAAAKTLTLTAATGPTNIFSGTITDGSGGGTVALTKAGVGLWVLSGNNNYTGATTITTGTLVGIGANAFGATSGISLTGTNTLSLRGDSNTTFASSNVTTSATGPTINVDQATIAGTGSKTMAIGTIGTSSTAGTYQLNFTGANNTSLSAGALSTPVSTLAAVHTINNISGGGSLTLASVFNQATTVASPNLVFAGTGNTTVTGAITQTLADMDLIKNGGGTLTLNASSTYTGSTSINGGTLFIKGATHNTNSIAFSGGGILGLDIASSVTAAGATVNFTGQTVTVIGAPTLTSYTLLTVGTMAGGDTEPTLSPAISGYELDVVGNELRLISTGAPTGFAAWQAANGGTSGGLGDDHDNDGVDNGTEFFLGGTNDTTGFTALPPVVNTGGTLSVTWPKGSGYNGTYLTHFVVETSDTLTGTWTVETLGGGNITDSPGSVKYTFPGGPAYTGKKFARLKVTGP